MKKLLFLLCLSIVSVFAYGQFFDGKYYWTYYYYDGISFKLVTDKTYQELADEFYTNRLLHKSRNDNKYIKRTFYINEIPLSKDDFSKLKLKKRDLVADSSYFTEDVFNDSIVRINLHAVLRIPICIDGLEYNIKDIIPLEALKNKELHFRRKNRLFRKDSIIIENVSHEN